MTSAEPAAAWDSDTDPAERGTLFVMVIGAAGFDKEGLAQRIMGVIEDRHRAVKISDLMTDLAVPYDDLLVAIDGLVHKDQVAVADWSVKDLVVAAPGDATSSVTIEVDRGESSGGAIADVT